MPAFHLLDKELVHIEQMLRRLAGLDATEQLSRSTAVVNKAYWRRRVEDLADRSNGDLALVERAATLTWTHYRTLSVGVCERTAS